MAYGRNVKQEPKPESKPVDPAREKELALRKQFASAKSVTPVLPIEKGSLIPGNVKVG